MRRILVLIATAALFGACGGGGSDALTEEEFVSKANAICKAGNAKAEAATENLADDASDEDIEKVFKDDVIPAIREQFDAIADLEPPDDIADDVDAMVESGRDALEEVESDISAAINSDDDPFADASEKANELGLGECGDE